MSIDPGLRRLALRTLLAAFPGHTPPGWAIDLVGAGLAGHTLFGTNVADPAQVATMTATLRAARPDVLIAIDEEGGDVTRLAHATGSPYPGNAALGAVDDPDLTRAVYRAIGDELATCGINLNLAPTVDVNTADDNPIIGTRSFGADPARVAAHAAAAVTGLQDAGIAACAKHFPGHGATVTDSHLELPVVDVPLRVLRDRDLPPFAAVVGADTRAIMTAHIRVPALTGDAPATLSPDALTGLLRQEYGFTGVIVTDALEMRGATLAAGGIVPAAVAALAAGADLLCVGARVDQSLVERIAAGIADAITDGTLPVGRVEQAGDRVGALASTVRRASDAAGGPSDLGYAAARLAVRVEGSLDGLGTPLVVHLATSSTIAEGRVPWGLGPHLDGTEHRRVVPADVTADALRTAAAGRPLVLVGRHIHRVPGARELIETLAAGYPVSVVEMGWPSPWRPAGVRAFVTTFGASHANGRAAAEALGLAA
ncbi:glycoside hydrolase family 3 N-terminal domain-containing protein [Solwaraspora sp. WMMD406]|uniref:glycoside hydrolase family 3 N-terminal domain-containing protein n=1 Tax=Solwaraspora sp. WMMD406 TaxID=3016095 RepID=UPI002415B4C2|nr:glycoside hydrolase family 3 N-terminal domain-containing protein [Solwaraspora sp. WMMD406]MDG4767350.1 glycoside hydrolase family 3 N-terminal domain-containing protein [Solwaraspora sp. WMMD406]